MGPVSQGFALLHGSEADNSLTNAGISEGARFWPGVLLLLTRQVDESLHDLVGLRSGERIGLAAFRYDDGPGRAPASGGGRVLNIFRNAPVEFSAREAGCKPGLVEAELARNFRQHHTDAGTPFRRVETLPETSLSFLGNCLNVDFGRVGMWRGSRRVGLSVAAPFVWRCARPVYKDHSIFCVT
jgi:hypothetical protein